jgi:MarR family 2-MHQ and catechol resistance regulon transcriptional repressor
MGALSVNALGERVLLTSGSITTAVQRLEKKGLLQRERSRLDARVVLVRLTSAGQDLIESNSSQHADNLEDLFVEFSEEERGQFEKLITKFDKRVQVLSK